MANNLQASSRLRQRFWLSSKLCVNLLMVSAREIWAVSEAFILSANFCFSMAISSFCAAKIKQIKKNSLISKTVNPWRNPKTTKFAVYSVWLRLWKVSTTPCTGLSRIQHLNRVIVNLLILNFKHPQMCSYGGYQGMSSGIFFLLIL